ncbi:putative epoxide hydrolase [Gordonia hirsuta DSM 44140 = NBRC 16056]|uniref:Putative epoxide hydrolase n=1 Tax=Gordonia hirsuta DSM 44140 = NBRC 16056 TaxID=1121927 RepID=L7LAN8_9ACTN|nr:putative epoxide hydrolase [Gordonia hirsuta DSM 44140 = NBRC 16056]
MDQYSYMGFTFDVVDAGTAKNGTIILLHGFPQTSHCWRKVTPILNAAGYRTVAPDQRGYSPGARPLARTVYRSSELIDDVVGLISRLDAAPVHVVGHDWGAAVAWGLAASRPDLVRTLTSVSVPHPGAFIKSFFSSDQLLRSWYMAAFQPPLLPDLLMSKVPFVVDQVLRRTGMDDEQIADVHRLVIDTGALPGALNWYRAMGLSSPPSLARRVAVPTTHVWGAHDPALSRRGAELAADFAVADFQLEILEDAGHWIPEHNAEKLAEIILARVAHH